MLDVTPTKMCGYLEKIIRVLNVLGISKTRCGLKREMLGAINTELFL